jgi:hypothetical protein
MTFFSLLKYAAFQLKGRYEEKGLHCLYRGDDWDEADRQTLPAGL